MEKVYLYSVEQEQDLRGDRRLVRLRTARASAATASTCSSSRSRDFNPIYGQTEFNHTYQDMARIYFVTLAKDTPSPFKPKSDEVGDEARRTARPAKGKEEPKREDAPIKVDLDGLQGPRSWTCRSRRRNYRHLRSVGSAVCTTCAQGSKDAERRSCRCSTWPTQKETRAGLGQRLRDLRRRQEDAGSQGRQVRHHRPAARPGRPSASRSTCPAWRCSSTGTQEWQQIFNECWRQMRDFFYDPNMHGVDWKAVRDKYEPLVAHVNHRADLTYVIGEMIGELNAGHAYVGGGDMPKPQRIADRPARRQDRAGPGHEVLPDREDPTRRANWDKNLRSPLTEIGVDAKEGDYIIAVNGQPTNEMINIYEALVNTVGKQVTLKRQRRAREPRAPRRGGRRRSPTRPSSTTTTGSRATSRR